MHGTDDTVDGTPRWATVDWALAMKPEDVAKRLGVSTRFVYKLIEQGQLHPVQLAGRRMILSEDLNEFIETLKRERDIAAATGVS